MWVKVKRSDFEAAIAAGELEEVAEDTPEADDGRAAADPFHAMHPVDDEYDDEDLSRLMAAADEKMVEPETSTTRETYNQLRAAVAAAEAERSAGGNVAGDASDDVYREDLASVVRPRRPVAAGGGLERPVPETRQAPLKLVAEQRVDTDAAVAPPGPVRPRRVASALIDDSANAEENDGAFAEFAAEWAPPTCPTFWKLQQPICRLSKGARSFRARS